MFKLVLEKQRGIDFLRTPNTTILRDLLVITQSADKITLCFIISTNGILTYSINSYLHGNIPSGKKIVVLQNIHVYVSK